METDCANTYGQMVTASQLTIYNCLFFWMLVIIFTEYKIVSSVTLNGCQQTHLKMNILYKFLPK